MSKKELIEYIRMLEKNYTNAEVTLDVQYKNIKNLYGGLKTKEEINKVIKSHIDESDKNIENLHRKFNSIGYNNLDYYNGRAFGYWLGHRDILKYLTKQIMNND